MKPCRGGTRYNSSESLDDERPIFAQNRMLCRAVEHCAFAASGDNGQRADTHHAAFPHCTDYFPNHRRLF